jgi:hypothetical protein
MSGPASPSTRGWVDPTLYNGYSEQHLDNGVVIVNPTSTSQNRPHNALQSVVIEPPPSLPPRPVAPQFRPLVPPQSKTFTPSTNGLSTPEHSSLNQPPQSLERPERYSYANPQVAQFATKTAPRSPRLSEVPRIVEISPGVFNYPPNSR